MIFDSLDTIHRALSRKEISSVELTEHYLSRIAQFNAQFNCFVSVDAEIALAQAQHIDAQRAQNVPLSPLAGTPLAHKDIFCMRDTITSCGSKMLAQFRAPYTATAIDKLLQAGSIHLGKLNMDEFAMGSTNETSHFGAVANPWNDAHVAGGSSGGSACAVALRLAAATTGTDTGGSIRQPAAWCGVTGLKPSYGRVSRYGMVAFASSLDQAGPIGKNVRDCALLLQTMAGFDPKDSTSIDTPVPDYLSPLNSASLKDITIGLPDCYFNEALATHNAHALEQAITALSMLGAQFKTVKLPHLSHAVAVYYILAPAEASSNLARFDGVRYGFRAEDATDLADMYYRTRGEGFGDEVKRRLMVGAYVLSAGYYDAYYTKAQQVRHLIQADFNQAFEQVDVILGPTTPTPAILRNAPHDPVSLYLNDLYTIPANLAGLPGLSIPIGHHQGLPLGMQLVGKYLDEATVLRVGHQYQQHTHWHTQMPPILRDSNDE